jgi:hypothetical protein
VAGGIKRSGAEVRIVEFEDLAHAFYFFPFFEGSTVAWDDLIGFVRE